MAFSRMLLLLVIPLDQHSVSMHQGKIFTVSEKDLMMGFDAWNQGKYSLVTYLASFLLRNVKCWEGCDTRRNKKSLL